jgi:hypothetical protein
MFRQPTADSTGHLTGKMHLEPAVANMPGDQPIAARDNRSLEATKGDASWICGNQGGRCAVAEKQETQHLGYVLERFLKMQATKFEIHYQHPSSGISPHHLIGEFQRVDGREAAHEAYDGALGAVAQASGSHDLKIEPRCGEARATRNNQVGNPSGIRVKRSDSTQGEFKSVRRVKGHTSRSGRKRSSAVDSGGVKDGLSRPGRWLKNSITVLNIGKAGHSIEQGPPVRINNRVPTEFNECIMDIIRWNRSTNAV